MKLKSHRSKVSFVWGALVGASLFGIFLLSALHVSHAGDLPLVHGSFQVEDTVGGDILKATTGVYIGGEMIGSASGGIWSQNGDDAYYSIGAVGIGGVPPSAYTDGQIYIQDLTYPRIGMEGLYPSILFYDWGTSDLIAGVTFDSINASLVFDASAGAIGSVTITDTGIEAGYVSATSATVTDVTSTGNADLTTMTVSGSASVGTLNSGAAVFTGTVSSISDVVVTGNITASDTMTTDDLYAATQIRQGTASFTASSGADELYLYSLGGTSAAGITLMSTNGNTAVIEAVSHPASLGLNRLTFQAGEPSVWNISVNGMNGARVYNDHIQVGEDASNKSYLTIPSGSTIFPASSGATGTAGTTIFYASSAGSYIYYCTESNSWGRVQLSAW